MFQKTVVVEQHGNERMGEETPWRAVRGSGILR